MVALKMTQTTSTQRETHTATPQKTVRFSEVGSGALLKPLAHLLADPAVSEIMINQPNQVWFERDGEMHVIPVGELNYQQLGRLLQVVANENGQIINAKKPLLSGSLQDGSRIQLVSPPCAKSPVVSIRRQVVRNLSLSDYQDNDFYQQTQPAHVGEQTRSDLSAEDQHLLALYEQGNWGRFIRASILAKKNLIISGGTSSGKTTFLNAALQQIPQDERIITLEDTYEIDIHHPNQVNLLATKGEQGESTVSMQDLVQCCLRLRPDRIIMGEIRGAEIIDFVSACSTGHEGSITSIHANNPNMAFMRMCGMYKQNKVSMTDADILKELHAVVDVIVQLGKDNHGKRIAQSIYFKHGHLAQEKPSITKW